MENGNMKWFEQAIGKEKIIHMFNGNIDVNEIYLHKILCYDYRLTILFHILNIPPVFPNKWNDKDFNAISMQLSFSDVSCINIYGNNLFNKMGTLNINVDENVVKMSLKGDEINIICESNFYFIDNITPEFINIEESTN
nr:Imm50 family immunity protein [Ornithobacterium rhinotracheale]